MDLGDQGAAQRATSISARAIVHARGASGVVCTVHASCGSRYEFAASSRRRRRFFASAFASYGHDSPAGIVSGDSSALGQRSAVNRGEIGASLARQGWPTSTAAAFSRSNEASIGDGRGQAGGTRGRRALLCADLDWTLIRLILYSSSISCSNASHLPCTVCSVRDVGPPARDQAQLRSSDLPRGSRPLSRSTTPIRYASR